MSIIEKYKFIYKVRAKVYDENKNYEKRRICFNYIFICIYS